MKLCVPVTHSYFVGHGKIKQQSLYFLFTLKVGHPYHIGENAKRGEEKK